MGLLDEGRAPVSAQAGLLNRVGAVPDLVLVSLPDISVRRNRLDRANYMRRLSFYDPDAWDEESRPFFHLPAEPPDAEVIETRPFQSGRCDLFSYRSRYVPRNPDVTADFNSLAVNLTGYLHLWRHDETAGRPLVLVIHGLMMGGPKKAIRMFKIDRLFEMGLDVGLHTLPGHWRRSDIPVFQRLLDPADLPLTAERMAQNVHDLHSALLLLGRLGYERTGIIGASLGGFTAALYATMVESGPEFMFMAVPAVTVRNYLRPQAYRFRFPVDEELVRATERAQRLFSPLYLEPRYDMSRVRVVAHSGDRVCEAGHTRRWVERWGIHDYTEVIGGHWLYLDRRARGSAWYGLLEEHGYIG